MRRQPTDEEITELTLLVAAFKIDHPELPDDVVMGTVEVRKIIAEWKRRHRLEDPE